MQKYNKTVPDCYTKIIKYDHCTQNRIIHTLPPFQVDCFSSQEINRVVRWSINLQKVGKTFLSVYCLDNTNS